MTDAIRVLGVDPGSVSTGWGVIERDAAGRLALLSCGSIGVSRRRALPDRLLSIFERLCDVIAEHRPHVLSIETAHSGPNVQSALRLGECRAVAIVDDAASQID